MHTLPKDFKIAIENSGLSDFWQSLTPLARNEWVCWVISAKKLETREKRIKVGIDKMKGGMRRPCCWEGCPHRVKSKR